MDKILIDRALLERAVYSLELAYETDTPTVRDICAVLSAPSGTPAMPVKAYYHEAPNEYGGLNKSVGLEVRKEFADAPLVLEADALARIACLEGEIAKRDARILGLESQYQRDVYGLNNEGDPIGGDPAGGYANDNARLHAELAAIKAQGVVMQSTDGGRNPRYEGLFDGETEEQRASRLNAAHAQQVSVPDASTDFSQFLSAVMDAAGLVRHGRRSKELSEYLGSKCMEYRFFAAPAAPAADAGLVEALEMALDIGDGCSRGFLGKFQAKARAALAAHRSTGVV